MHILSKLAKSMEKGLSSSDLPHLQEIITICLQRIQDGITLYTESITSILANLASVALVGPPCSKPDFSSFLRALATHLNSTVPGIAKALSNTFLKWQTASLSQPDSPLAIAFKDSGVVALVASSLLHASLETRPVLLEVIVKCQSDLCLSG